MIILCLVIIYVDSLPIIGNIKLLQVESSIYKVFCLWFFFNYQKYIQRQIFPTSQSILPNNVQTPISTFWLEDSMPVHSAERSVGKLSEVYQLKT